MAVFGVGGVGGWCAEALVRSGVSHIMVADDDAVAASNVNRQLQALPENVGKAKVEVLAKRLRAIDPEAEIVVECRRFTPENAVEWNLGRYDCVVDAIDSVDCKAALMLAAESAGCKVYSSMGAALRRDPSKLRFCRFSEVSGDGLARALRRRFKTQIRKGELAKMPNPFCVCSTEPPVKSEVRGSMMPVTCAFGMGLAALLINGET